jgi:hypothetical protein
VTASIAPQRAAGEAALPAGDAMWRIRQEMYVLHLALLDNRTGQTLINRDLFYADPDEIDDLIMLQFNRVSDAPEVVPETVIFTQYVPEYITVSENIREEPDNWRDKEWYFGACAFWAPRVYQAEASSTYYVNFGFGLFAEYHFLGLSAGTGVELAPDWIAVTSAANDSYRDLVLEIPLLIKYILKPSKYFMLVPYAGINLNLALYGETRPPLLAWRLGFQYGVKAGPGVLIIDPWFSMDFGRSRLGEEKGDDTIRYQRYMMHIGLGYKYGVDRSFFSGLVRRMSGAAGSSK